MHASAAGTHSGATPLNKKKRGRKKIRKEKKTRSARFLSFPPTGGQCSVFCDSREARELVLCTLGSHGMGPKGARMLYLLLCVC